MLEILPISYSFQHFPKKLPIIPFIVTYYSHKILSGYSYIACRQFWSCKIVNQCKCCWCSSETSTVRGCISAERSIYSNRTVSSPVIIGLLTVLLEYIAERSQQLLPQPQPSDKSLLSHHAQKQPKILKLCL